MEVGVETGVVEVGAETGVEVGVDPGFEVVVVDAPASVLVLVGIELVEADDVVVGVDAVSESSAAEVEGSEEVLSASRLGRSLEGEWSVVEVDFG